MFAFLYFLSNLIVVGVFAYLFYSLHKRNTNLHGEVEILGGLVKAHGKKSERRLVEATVKIVGMEKRMKELEGRIEKNMEHIEAQNGVLSQRITNMKKSVQEDEK